MLNKRRRKGKSHVKGGVDKCLRNQREKEHSEKGGMLVEKERY